MTVYNIYFKFKSYSIASVTDTDSSLIIVSELHTVKQ